MHNAEYIVVMIFCLCLISLSTFFIFFSDNAYHEIIHVLSLFGTIFLAGLSFKAFYTYRIVRMLCAAFAFLLFGGAEGLEIIEDFSREEYKEYDSIAEIRDYFIILGIGVFALGTISSRNK